MLSDAEYLVESTDLTFFIRHLVNQIASVKPENLIEFSEKYFRKIESCHHILGADYNFIAGCKYNRRSFVFCLLETFSNFLSEEKYSLFEYQQIIELLCNDFPKNIILDAAYAVNSKSIGGMPSKYLHGELSIALYFHILFEDWLKEIEKLFREESSLNCLSISRIRSFILNLQSSLPLTVEQPPLFCIESVFNGIAKEISINYDDFRRCLFSNPAIIADVKRTPRTAKPIMAASCLDLTA